MSHSQALTESTAVLAEPAAIPHSIAHRDDYAEDARPTFGRSIPVLVTASGFHSTGHIQEIRRDSLSIQVHQPLPKGSAVSIEFGAISRDGEVVSCDQQGNDFDLGIAIPNGLEYDSRRTQRFPIQEEVKIYKPDSDSALVGEVANLSVEGIGLESPVPLEPGEILLVECKGNSAFAVVRHVSPLPDGVYRAGLEVLHVMPADA